MHYNSALAECMIKKCAPDCGADCDVGWCFWNNNIDVSPRALLRPR